MESFKKYFLNVIFKQYFALRGRSTRKEYWMFILFHLLVLFCIGFILGNLTHGLSNQEEGIYLTLSVIFIYYLITLCPSTAIGVRRFHDVGLSGWFFLLAALIFPIAIIIVCLIKSGPDNRHGPNKITGGA